MFKRLRISAVVVSLLAGLNFAARASAAENPVHWSLDAVPQKALRPGAPFAVRLVAAIDSGWHLYAMDQEEGGPVPTEISLASENSFLTLGTVHASKPIQLLDPNFNKQVSLYVDKAEFRLPLTVSTDASSGQQRTNLQVRYQCCNERMCLPPRIASLDLIVLIKASK